MDWRAYQQRQRIVELGDRYLSYLDQGEGAPVVLLHGIPTWGYLWDDLAARLDSRWRVLVPDLLGFGYSDKSDRFDRSISAQAEAVERWLDLLGIERATVVGHDLGGAVALRIGALRPERIERLCVMNTACYDAWPVEVMLQLGHPALTRLVSARTLSVLMQQGLRLGFHRAPPARLLAGLVAPYGTEVGKLSLVRDAVALDTNLTMELNALLPKIERETLVLWGEGDRFLPVQYGERLAADLPRARLIRLMRARHFVMHDRLDEVAELLELFLSRGLGALAPSMEVPEPAPKGSSGAGGPPPPSPPGLG